MGDFFGLLSMSLDSFLQVLSAAAHQQVTKPTAEIDDAMRRFDTMFDALSAALEVEHFGPFVGVETLKAHQLVVRLHRSGPATYAWGLRVCSTAPSADFRPEWTPHGASRMRRPIIVRALPELVAGFSRAVLAAGKTGSPAGQRIHAIAQHFIP